MLNKYLDYNSFDNLVAINNKKKKINQPTKQTTPPGFFPISKMGKKCFS